MARGRVSKTLDSLSTLWSDIISVGNAGEKETFFFMRSGAGLFGVVVVSVDCIDCIDAIDDSENVRLCLGVLSSSQLSKE